MLPKDARPLPGIGIVLTSSGDPMHLRRCLDRFLSCWADAQAEVIVVRASARGELASLAQEFASATIITWVGVDSGTPESELLRRVGLERSRREIVLFLADREVERHEWAASLCRNWRAWTDAGGRVINAPTCGAELSSPYPYLSVVMPVHNGGSRFPLALQALALSNLPRQSWELVVVDDASTDETATVAAQYADKLLRLRPEARGPGYARNRGFELTLGECIAFINADVMVETDTLRNGAKVLTEHPGVGAVFGSCDASPMATGILSEYRSLVQRYYHRRDAENAFTFSSACGIIRSSVFERAGGYDEWHFSRRQIEDLELGQRIRALGERIVVHTDIRAAHLREWTVRRMIATEIFDRTIPWMRLVQRQLTRDRRGPHGKRAAKNVNIVVSWIGAICGILAWSGHSLWLSLAALSCLGLVLVNNAAQLAFFARERGFGFAAVSVPLDVLYYLVAGVGVLFGWIARQAVGEPTPGAAAEAFAEMGKKRWPPVPVKRVARPSAVDETRVADRLVPPTSALPDLPVLPQGLTINDPPSDSSQQLQ
ncbi:MAG TPA: glycosyltransferase family A protein [Gemmatimonadaceae bacterium]|jgi:glycosyltransferase involved in cell wall biosynthesis